MTLSSPPLEQPAPAPSRLLRFAQWLDDGRLIKFAFFAMLVGSACAIGIDWWERENQTATLPQYDPTTSPILPAIARPELDPNNPALQPDGNVTTPADILREPMQINLSPNGVLLLQGTISPGVAQQLSEELSLRGEYIQTIQLDSPGGIVQEALAMGEIIRNSGFATKVDTGALCASSCPLILASGTQRHAEEGAVIGVHQIYNLDDQTRSAAQAVSDAQAVTAQIGRYLDEMGIDPKLWFHALETPPARLYYLTHQEMEQFNLHAPKG